MPDSTPTGNWPGRVSIGVVRGDPSAVYVAESDAVLSRLLALKLVASSPATTFAQTGDLERVRDALLAEQWADAVLAWMESTGEIVDTFSDELIVTERQLDADSASIEIRVARIFDDPS